MRSLVGFAVVWTLVLMPGASLATEVSDSQVARAAQERAEFGLSTDPTLIRSLIGSGTDVGTSKWGIVLGAEEEAILDLNGRMEFASAVHDDVLPYAAKLESYAGSFIDQRDGGRLVILLTKPDPTIEAELAERTPPAGPGLRIEYADVPYSRLVSGVHEARSAWEAIVGGPLPAVGIDEERNAVRFEVLEPQLDQANLNSGALALAVGAPVVIAEGAIGVADVCTSRDNCHGPMKGGIRIYKGSTSGAWCTMGFHIRRNATSDEQFLTSGHCSTAPPSSDSWWHPNYGKIGDEAGSAYFQGGYDAIRVQMADVQASDDIYGASSNIVGSRTPTEGEVICASMGRSNTIDCGTVREDWHSYFMTECWCSVWGADHDGINRTGGDSGSPIYVGESSAVAIGIHSNSNGAFARVQDLLIHFSASIVT